MPELPEVETVAIGLRELLVGEEIKKVSVLRREFVAYPSNQKFCRSLVNKKVEIKELADVATSSQADVLALNTFILLADVSKYISPLALDPPPGLVLGAELKGP